MLLKVRGCHVLSGWLVLLPLLEHLVIHGLKVPDVLRLLLRHLLQYKLTPGAGSDALGTVSPAHKKIRLS